MSTIISLVALVGVVMSLLLQRRQARTTELQILRMTHLELIRLAIENPELVVEHPDSGAAPIESRRMTYVNLQFKHLQYALATHQATADGVRLELRRQFSAEHRRMWWAVARVSYADSAVSRGQRRFVEIADE